MRSALGAGLLFALAFEFLQLLHRLLVALLTAKSYRSGWEQATSTSSPPVFVPRSSAAPSTDAQTLTSLDRRGEKWATCQQGQKGASSCRAACYWQDSHTSGCESASSLSAAKGVPKKTDTLCFAAELFEPDAGCLSSFVTKLSQTTVSMHHMFETKAHTKRRQEHRKRSPDCPAKHLNSLLAAPAHERGESLTVTARTCHQACCRTARPRRLQLLGCGRRRAVGQVC